MAWLINEQWASLTHQMQTKKLQLQIQPDSFFGF